MGRPSTRKTRNPKNVKIRYAVFTEGLVTERQYLELLYQQIRPKHATIKIHAIGGEPSRVLKECNKALRKDDFDHAILIVDVDQHQRLDEVLTSCRNSSEVDTIVSNPCFELWLLWHTQNQTGYIESRGCGSSPVEWCNRFVSFGVGYALSWSGVSSCWVGWGVSRDLVRTSRLR